MRASIAVAGIVILIIGVALLGYGVTTPVTNTITSTTTVTTAAMPQTNRNIDPNGIWSSGAQVLQKGEVLTGTFSISNYSSSAGRVFFYLQNESQFIAWGGCAPCNSPSINNWTAPSSGQYQFTWTVPYTGAFYFVFDDEGYGAVAPASFSATGVLTQTPMTTSTGPNSTLNYSGAALIVVGALILAAGLIARSPAKKAAKPMATQEAKDLGPKT